MTETNCGACGALTPLKSLYDLNDKHYCAPCAQHAVEIAKSAGQPANIVRAVDKLLCARCNSYLSEGVPFTQDGNIRFCQPCAAMVRDWQYPQWLRLSLAALLLLLVVALANGAKYFSAGKSLYVGERLVQESKYTEALPHLQKTLNVAPNSDKAALLAAKAAILSGHPEIAQKALQGHAKGYFDDASNPQFQEVNGLWNRTNKAMDEIDKAQKLEEQDGQEMQAAQLMHAAAADYPQMPNIALAVDYYDSGAAFARKDYDQFLAIGEKDWKLQPSWSTALSLVSSLDCKYAATGDEQYRTRSEEMFIKSRELGKDDKEAERVISEFSDRHKYRIQTRKIISKQEFDRQFRNNGKGEKKN